MLKRHLLGTFLLNQAGGLGDGGGSGGSPDPSGNSNPDSGNDPASGNNGAGDFNGPEWARDFTADLGIEIVNDPSLKAIKDVKALAKSYVHAQKALGKKGLNIPNENSTQEEWDTFHQTLGVPLDEKAYGEALKLPEESIFKDSAEDIKKIAHELRIKPDQASKLLESINAKVTERNQLKADEYKAQAQQGLDSLMTSMGEDAYNVKLNKTTIFLKEQMPEFLGYLKESGLGNDHNVVRALMKVTDMVMGEDVIPKGTGGHGMSIQEIESSINNIMGDFNDPYHKADHPNHNNRVNEVLNMRRKLDKLNSR